MADEAVMDVAGETDADLDTSSDDGAGDGVDSSGADDVSTTAEVEAEGDGTPVVSDANGALKLSPRTKATLDEIKAKDATLAKQIRASLFDSAALRQQFPEGVKEVAALKAAYDEVGGAEGIETLKGALNEWDALDQDFQNNPEKFVTDISTSNPEAFLKVALPVFHKFSELNPEGFSAYASKIFAGDMAAHNIPLTMMRFRDLIGDNKPAMDMWTTLAGYMDRITDNAAKPINTAATKPGKTDDAGLNEREQRVATQEKAQLTREFSSDRERIRTQVENAEFTRLSAGRKISETQKAAIKELFDARIKSALNTDADYKGKVDRFFAAKDKAGYSRHVQAAYKAKTPRIMEAVFNSVVPGKPGPVKKPGEVLKPIAGKPAVEGTGWTRVSVKPTLFDVNHAKRTPAMVREGKYPMKDGRMLLYSKG